MNAKHCILDIIPAPQPPQQPAPEGQANRLVPSHTGLQSSQYLEIRTALIWESQSDSEKIDHALGTNLGTFADIRLDYLIISDVYLRIVAETEGFEPSIGLYNPITV